MATTMLALLAWPACCYASSLAPENMANATCTTDGRMLFKKQSFLPWLGRFRAPMHIYLAERGRTVELAPVTNGGIVGQIFMDREQTLVLKGEFHQPSPYGCAQREICVYRYLASRGFTRIPRLLCASEEFGIILMAHAGPPASSANLPADYRSQAEELVNGMHDLGVKHQDICKGNGTMRQVRMKEPEVGFTYGRNMELAVNHGTLVVYDFSWATVNGSYACSPGNPSRVHHLLRPRADRDIMIYLDRLAARNASEDRSKATTTLGSDDDKELHLIILWNPHHPAASSVYLEALASFTVVGVRVHPAYEDEPRRLKALNRFYQANRHGMNVDAGFPWQRRRGAVPFAILFVSLPKSRYGSCKGGASARGKKSCPATNAFKIAARANRGLVVHATDSIQETQDNLAALGIDYDAALSPRRPQWRSWLALLESLNASGARYVVARNFECEGLEEKPLPCRLDDLDLLADDCLRVAYALEPAVGNTPPQSLNATTERSSVKSRIDVTGKHAVVDARCPGSGYLDDLWIQESLDRREMHPAGGFYVMQVPATLRRRHLILALTRILLHVPCTDSHSLACALH
jgi:hypothetical protein